MMRTLGQRAMLITGLLACPCHLPIVLPLVLGVLGGTALGVWISSNLTLVYGMSTVYFVIALVVGLGLMQRRKAAPSATSDPTTCCALPGNDHVVETGPPSAQTLVVAHPRSSIHRSQR